jgi:hypothetical protein
MSSPSGKREKSQPFEKLTNVEKLEEIRRISTENDFLKLRICMSEKFLEETNPKALQKVQRIIKLTPDEWFEKGNIKLPSDLSSNQTAFRKSKSKSVRIDAIGHEMGHNTKTQNSRRNTLTATRTKSILKPRATVNLATKIDIAEKLIKNYKKSVQNLITTAHEQTQTKTAIIDEQNLDAKELQNMLVAFEEYVMVQGIDPMLKKVPAERFVKFLNGLIKDGNKYIEKLRLRMSVLKQQRAQQYQLLVTRKNLSKILRPIDYEQLLIEKMKAVKLLEERNEHWIGLKRVTGLTALALSNQQKIMIETQMTLEVQVEKIDEMKKRKVKMQGEGNLGQNFDCYV